MLLKQGTPSPLPRDKLLVICLCYLCDSVSQTQLLPFVVFMVRDMFHLREDNSARLVGYYSGWLASSFSFAQFLSSFFWGAMSDRIGRKPVILIGLAATTLFSFLFGMSSSFEWALVTRLLCGLINGNLGVVKTYTGEITDSTNQARGFAKISLTAGLGRVIGPVLGGFLSQPVEKYPAWFSRNGLFDRYPYLLPCMVTSSMGLVGLVMGYLFLTETKLPARRFKRKDEEEESGKDLFHFASYSKGTSNSSTPGLLYELKTAVLSLFNRKSVYESNHSKRFRSPPNRILRRDILLSTGLYGSCAFVFSMFDESFPLLLANGSSNGGLDFKSNQIGFLQSCGGVSLVIYQLFFYPRIAEHLGALRTFQMGVIGSIPILVVIPFIQLLIVHGQSASLWPTMILVFICRTVFAQTCFTSVFLLINNSAPRAILGTVNGLGQSLTSLSRAIAPALATNTLAWSFTNGLGYPFDFHFLYHILCVLTTGIWLLSRYLDASIDHPQHDKSVSDQELQSLLQTRE